MDPTNLEESVLQATKLIEEQVDAAIEKLDKLEDEDLQALQRKRAAALKKQMKKKDEWIANGHGQYSELASEKEFFDVCKKSENLVCHFYRSSTMRCAIVDKHLTDLAPKHIETKFCKIDAEKSPFLTQRLKIRVLPTIVLCKDAKSIDVIVGFDDLGGVDDFSTEILEWRIAQAEVINYSGDLTSPPGTSKQVKKSFITFKPKTIRGHCDDSDSD
ncbi:thioredoxin domain-containing protein 9-like [Stegodyphus dumicola]|uniref:thioredoxin domain-containing protein 9-like n=1 Tax=Stegodyphus dumicola TaxID=202533 RepID=UPI0015B2BA64|nr:thioredoxin domain-containing protein 9-like [Stegodyphus dumicola]